MSYKSPDIKANHADMMGVCIDRSRDTMDDSRTPHDHYVMSECDLIKKNGRLEESLMCLSTYL